MFSSELIFTLDVQKLKDLSEVYFTENSNSVSSILSMSSSGKANIFNSGGLESDFKFVDDIGNRWRFLCPGKI